MYGLYLEQWLCHFYCPLNIILACKQSDTLLRVKNDERARVAGAWGHGFVDAHVAPARAGVLLHLVVVIIRVHVLLVLVT